MRADSWRWVEVTPSQYVHERLGLEHVRQHLPDAWPYCAWSNFEFEALDGTPYEIDLLALGPGGLHLVELKAWSGRITGDDRNWLEHNPGARHPIRRTNPLSLARTKAQKLRSWLERHPANTRRVRIPFVQESLFLHGVGVDCRLPEATKQRVFGLEDAAGNGLQRIVTDRIGVAPDDPRARGSRSVDDSRLVEEQRAKQLIELIKSAGLRRRPRETRVGEWVLDDQPYDSGWGWQDTLATHHAFSDRRARVRRWFVPAGASARDAALVRAAAEREFRYLLGLTHPGLIGPTSFFEDDHGVAALVYPHDDSWVSLASWLGDHRNQLDVLDQVGLVRDVAEVVRYAHDHGVVHRGLNPASVMITPHPDGAEVRVKDWQAMGQAEPSSTTATAHAHDLLEHADDDARQVYAAPELLTGPGDDRRRGDVFSLGALAYRVLTDAEPASDVAALRARLSQDGGLDLEAVLDAPPALLRDAVLEATRPVPSARTASSGDLIENLDLALEELTEPDRPTTDLDPLDAQPGAVLDGDLVVRRLLGTGSTSVALLVDLPDGREAVLKAARDDDRARRLEDEAAALRSLSGSALVVGLLDGPLRVGGRSCLLMEVAGERTLAAELREAGRVSLDRLSLWGRDLFEVLAEMERAGVVHRDIKPANLAYRKRSADGRPHLILFDFSLAAAPARDISSGTRGYLDPFLGSGTRRQYDPAAELFAAAVTLYELATGRLPGWGDGQTDPASVPDEVTIATELLDPQAAQPLTEFFRRALARDVGSRFDNAQDAASAWQRALDVAASSHPEIDPDEAAAAATLATPLAQAGLSPNALSALEPYAVATIEDLLALDPMELGRLRGSAASTRTEIISRTREWRNRLRQGRVEARSIDAVVARLLRDVSVEGPAGRAVRVLLGQPDRATGTGSLSWPTTYEVSNELDLSRSDVTTAWRSFLASRATQREAAGLRGDVVEVLRSLGGIGSAAEVSGRVVARRGSYAEDPLLTAQALAVVRVAVECELAGHETVAMRRSGDVLMLATGDETQTDSADDLLDAAVLLTPVAERLASAEVLPSPDVALARLQETASGTLLEQLPASRLLSLAAAATTTVAVSPRGELYARAMPAIKAIRFARATLVTGGASLSEDMVRRRVRARFPKASPVPSRPELDRLLADAGTGLVWTGDGYGVSTDGDRGSTGSSTWHGGDAPERITVQLRARVAEGDFLAVAVAARMHAEAVRRLIAEVGARPVNLTQNVLKELRALVEREGASWSEVLAADALVASHPDRQLVDDLVRQTATDVLTGVQEADGPVLLTDAAILAHHHCVDLLEPLASFARSAAHGVLLLVPQETSQDAATLDGAAVPVASPNQWVRLPAAWVHAGSSGTL